MKLSKAQGLAEQAIYDYTSSTKWQQVKYMKWTTSEMQDVIATALVKNLTIPVVVENKELPVYKVVFNEGSDDGVTSINLTKTPLLNAKQTGEHLRSSCDWCNPPQRK
jgi:hypothetical protein